MPTRSLSPDLITLAGGVLAAGSLAYYVSTTTQPAPASLESEQIATQVSVTSSAVGYPMTREEIRALARHIEAAHLPLLKDMRIQLQNGEITAQQYCLFVIEFVRHLLRDHVGVPQNRLPSNLESFCDFLLEQQ